MNLKELKVGQTHNISHPNYGDCEATIIRIRHNIGQNTIYWEKECGAYAVGDSEQAFCLMIELAKSNSKINNLWKALNFITRYAVMGFVCRACNAEKCPNDFDVMDDDQVDKRCLKCKVNYALEQADSLERTPKNDLKISDIKIDKSKIMSYRGGHV